MDDKDLTIDQKRRLHIARMGLRSTVLSCKEKMSFGRKSLFLHQAEQGISALSLAEASWLQQKQWSPIEKTFILYYVDQIRHKKKQLLPFRHIVASTVLASSALATQYTGHSTLASILAGLAVATAADGSIDYVQTHFLHKMFQKHLQESIEKNDNIKTGIRCLNPQYRIHQAMKG